MASWEKIITEGDDASYKNSNVGSSDLPIASSSAVGGVKIGSGVTVGMDGSISVASGSDTTNSSMSFNTSSGVLTLTDSASNTTTVDLDGRFLTSQTDSQALSISGQTLSLSNGGSVTLPDADTQDLSISGRSVSLTNGGSVSIPASSSNDFTTTLKNKLDGIEASANVTDTANVTSAGALMDSECNSVGHLKNIDQDLQTGSSPSFSTTNMTDATNKRFMSNSQEVKLDGLVSCTTTNVQSALSALDSTKTLSIGDSGNDTTVNINGNLTVSGTTTTVNSTNVNIGDNIITLNADETGTPSQSAGIEVERGTGTNVSNYWRESDGAWTIENASDRAQIQSVTLHTSAPGSSSNALGVGHMWYDSTNRKLYVRKT